MLRSERALHAFPVMWVQIGLRKLLNHLTAPRLNVTAQVFSA